MKTLEQIAKDLIGRNFDEIDETYEDYEFEGVNSIIISQCRDMYDYQVYADHKNAPIIGIKLGDDGDQIVEADIL